MGKELKESPANVLVDQGLNQYLKDDVEKAVTLWKSALKLDPDNPRAKQFLDQATTEGRDASEREVKVTGNTFQTVIPDLTPPNGGDAEFDSFINDLSDHAAAPEPSEPDQEFEAPDLTQPMQQSVLDEQLDQLHPVPTNGPSTSSFEVDEATPTHLVKREGLVPDAKEAFPEDPFSRFDCEEQTPTHLMPLARPPQGAQADDLPAARAFDLDAVTLNHLYAKNEREISQQAPPPPRSAPTKQSPPTKAPQRENFDDLEITISTADLGPADVTEEPDFLDDIPITLDLDEEPPAPKPALKPIDTPRIIRPEALRGPSRGQIVAMDFGTTRSRVAAMVGGKINVIPLPGGSTDIPSMVAVRSNGAMIVGYGAREMLVTDPANVIPYPRRVIGRKYRDPQIAGYLANLAIHTTEWSNGGIIFHAQGREYTAPQICAPILQTLRLAAERFIGERVTEVVLTTPLGFSSTQLQALALAAELAGLEVTQFVEEPVAAALANRADPGFHNLVGVYDFGGGTFDYSVISLQDNHAKVITTAGDTWLGGEDFEETLANSIADDFWRKHNIEVRNSKVQWQRLLVKAEQAKQKLSENPLATVAMPAAALTSKGQLDITFPISRTKFVELSRGLIDRSLATCQEALDQEGLKVSDLSAIYLSSGTTLIPAVQDAVVDFFQQVPRFSVPPERAVLLGSLLAARARKK